MRVLVSSVLAFGEPLSSFLSYVVTGLILGAINALVLYKFAGVFRVVIVFLTIGAVAGWGAALGLSMAISAFAAPLMLGWVLGLASFVAILVGLTWLLGLGAERLPPQTTGPVVSPTKETTTAPAKPVQEPAAALPKEAPPVPPQAAVEATPPPQTQPAPTTAPPPQPPVSALKTQVTPSVVAPPPPQEPLQSIDEIEDMLIEIMVDEGLTELVPLPNNTSPEGGFYPEIEERLGIDTTTLIKVVRRLIDKNSIKLAGVEFKKVACPHCQSALNILTLSCRACGSTNIGRQRILQHETCGYLGPEDSFTISGRTICPRCGSSVKILKGPLEEVHEQILKVHSSFFICYNCNEVSPDPHISFKCLTCGLDYDLSSFEFKTFYRYAINPDMISILQEQKRPLKLIAEELRRMGYEVQLNARVTGSSKVRHKVDLLYGKLGQTRGAIFLFGDRGGAKIHEVMKIIVMRADTKIENVKILCLGQLDNDSKRLAELYNIAVIENLSSKELATEVMSRLIS